jgi:general secretion pathway protein A
LYEQFFGFTVKPFELLPDPDFLFPSRSHKRALTYLEYGIRERSGFILLTGEIGSGKTTIIRNLLKQKDEKVIVSKIHNTRVDTGQLLALINEDFGLPVDGSDKIILLRDLNDFLIRQYAVGKQPVLVIDEAQNLSEDHLEEIRLLSNLEDGKAKLLQIILVGQPELRRTLAAESLIQLRQRISINCQIHPLNRGETELYILHRMERAGNRTAVAFHEEALELIFRTSRGIPRLTNILCDYLLLTAFAAQSLEIDETMVMEVLEDLDFEKQYWDFSEPPAGESEKARMDPHWKLWTGKADKMLKSLDRQLGAMSTETVKMSSSLEPVNRMEKAVNAMSFRLNGMASFVSMLESKLSRIEEKVSGPESVQTQMMRQEKDKETRMTFLRRFMFW